LFVIGGGLRAAFLIDWRPHAESLQPLAFIGRQDDVTGVLVHGIEDYNGGNYFYLRRNIPLYYITPGQIALFRAGHRIDSKVNYIVAQPQQLEVFTPYSPREVAAFDNWRVYRVTVVPKANAQ
jgi:hypothetical protein